MIRCFRNSARGEAEGRAETMAKTVRALLRQHGIVAPTAVPVGFASAHLAALNPVCEEEVLAAASGADSFAHFLARLDRADS